MSPQMMHSPLMSSCEHEEEMWAGVSRSMQVWAHTSHTCKSRDVLPEPAHNPIVFFNVFLFIFCLNPSTVTIDAVKQSVNRASRLLKQRWIPAPHPPSLYSLSLSLSLAKCIFFPLSMKAPGRLPDNPRRRNDTRYSLSRRLCAQHSCCFCCWAIRRYDQACFEKEKKRSRSCLRRNKSKIDFNSTIQTHWWFFFIIYGRTKQKLLVAARAGLRVQAGLFMFKDVKKNNTNE